MKLHNTTTKSFVSKTAFIVGGLLLFFYPMVFFASLLSLLGMIEFGTSFWLLLTSQIFLWLSLLYPVFYIGCIWVYVRRPTAQYRGYLPFLPFLYITICFCFFVLWGVVEAFQEDTYENYEVIENYSEYDSPTDFDLD